MKKLIACGALTLSMAASSLGFAAAQTAPTIRTLSGAQATESLPANATALLVIDFQNEYFIGKMPIPDGLKALKNTQRLVAFAHRHNMPVFFVRHLGPANGPLFAEGSTFAEFHPELQPAAGDKVITKATPSSFVGTDLDRQLKQAGIRQLIVSGLMTHMCVSSTARDAVPLGYQVIIPADATATRSLATWDNQVVNHAVLQRAALAGVADVFAEIKTTGQVLALPVN
ncbi:Peroxyureidoacrylate/ureidoacrylate amidohydrolase RutB [Serratia entomophila]|uniref:cysteine hydrolase family protein n=1 Tax=Serratia entomophila TaxID=42906 RepID=UPI001F4267CB|nr:cysteine hydrolase family protein [Serratia entomophila]UIW16824.1 cysteine hydrolase [Serratia entomophila]CAI0721007.1 Peroxyureidoacrylate/ureidoacrylate amidohydrolase RutB [Serratia entomophila]CAI0721969.1 Peroxyureidoacrylate/ureidoacrylate amidohydrolase RutB [Serratia entomophila]CAI0722067.1 Peroxyureidoacrylate/ureidoacrylate amidohydrolase RutB [Serratia entomophila]CAI0731488.1 Peroxyureidoacrylate/ureidoacrylate amidohydrolase RutB [Serratia entomophila]